MTVVELPLRTAPIEAVKAARATVRGSTRPAAWVAALPLAAPLVGVNAVAVAGQTMWALDHLTRAVVLAVGFAATLESIAVYLAWEAHVALMAGDAAFRLRLSSYLMAGVVAALNYTHWAPDWTPNAKALTFALFSVISPWLWSIRSRSMHREQLRAKGLIDPRSVRFSAARWVWHPWRTFGAHWQATWDGTIDPGEAIARYNDRRPVVVDRSTATPPAVEATIDHPIEVPVESRIDPAIEAPQRPAIEAVPSPRSTSRKPRRRSTRSTRPPARTIEDLAALITAAIQSGQMDPRPKVEPTRRYLQASPDRTRQALRSLGLLED